jgi:hypothetical protein
MPLFNQTVCRGTRSVFVRLTQRYFRHLLRTPGARLLRVNVRLNLLTRSER